MICGAMDMSVLDDVRQVDDRQSFLMARRACREEGLLAGGSSGAALHVAVEVAREMRPDQTVVTILPDGGRAYITKFYSDEWMRDMGFMPEAPDVGTVGDLLEVKTMQLVVATPQEKAQQVVHRMKQYGISQMPIVDAGGKALGMIHESDLLSALLEGKHRLDQPIDPLVSELHGVVERRTPLWELKHIFGHDHVAVVQDNGRIVGVVTQIDLIDYLGQKMNGRA